MDLIYVLFFYGMIVFALSILFYITGIKGYPSILLALISGQVLISILKPPIRSDQDHHTTSQVAFYLAIQYLTPIIGSITLIVYLIKDKRIEFKQV